MSEAVTIAGVSPSPTIYGTVAAGVAYITAMFGDTYTAWLDLDADDRNRTFVAATRFLDQQVWVEAYDTFAERDALAAFPTASYELAVLISDDPAVLAELDSGSNLQSANAGGAGVTYFNPSSAATGSASLLPPVLQRLVGAYLAAGDATSGSYGASGSCESPFSSCSEYDRNEPY